MRSRPDILVLGGGGVLGEAWMVGVLAGIEDAHGIRFSDCDYLLGTSAGAIIAVDLAAGIAPRRPASAGEITIEADGPTGPAHTVAEATIRTGLGIAAALTGPWVRFGLTVAAPGGAFLRTCALRLAPLGTGTHAAMRETVRGLNVRFDGRLRITAVERLTGNRVIFGSPSAPEASVVDALAASCAVPARFAPVVIGGAEYVDGGIWSPTNLDAAPAHRGAQVLCLSPTGSLHGPLTAAIRIPSRGRTLLEVAATRSVGADVELLTPDRASAAAIGSEPMADGPAASVLAAGYAQGLRS